MTKNFDQTVRKLSGAWSGTSGAARWCGRC